MSWFFFKYQFVIASCGAAAGDLAHNPGMGPDWESNLQPFGSQASAQSTEPHQPGHEKLNFMKPQHSLCVTSQEPMYKWEL